MHATMDLEALRHKAIALVAHLVPLCLAGGVVSMLAYRIYGNDSYDWPLRHFLSMIVVQMLPLVALKLKVWKAEDRVGILPRFAVKTLLMHVAMITFRIPSYWIYNLEIGSTQVYADFITMAVALAILNKVFGFRWGRSAFTEHSDVRSMIVLALVAAAGTDVLSTGVSFFSKMPAWNRRWISNTLLTASNYVDITAFVPIVWMMYRVERSDDSDGATMGQVITADLRRQALSFFSFLVCFYAVEDLAIPINSQIGETMAMAAHVAHFCLLLDFTAFMCFQVFSQQSSQGKPGGEQLRGLLSQDLEDGEMGDLGDDFM